MKSVTLSRLIIAGALLVLVIGGVRIGMKRYFRVPVRVASGSMAPALVGPHIELLCGDCGFSSNCGVEHLPQTKAICSNCGGEAFAKESPVTDAGQRVYIDRQYQGGASLERWRLIAFADPTDRTRMAVKRVVALPGENVSLHAGDVIIDNTKAEKSLAEFLSLAVLVHDDRFRPPAETGAQHRWAGDWAVTNWRPTETGYACNAEPNQTNEPAAEETVDWLLYRNLRCFASPSDPRGETPIHDAYAYNQSLSRKPNTVVDIGVTCQCDADSGEIQIEFRQIEPACRLRLNRNTGMAEVSLGENTIARERIVNLKHHQRFQLTAVWCDGRLLVGIGDQSVLAVRPDATDYRQSATANPLAIGVTDGKLSVTGVRVLRDLYYLPARTSQLVQPECDSLSENGLFVLGDNSPDSRDSRYWRPNSLQLNDIIGRVIR